MRPNEILLVLLAVALVLVLFGLVMWGASKRRARRVGYASVGEYLRAVPRSDEEKQDAVDLALKGLAICLVGLFLTPLFLIGVFPLYYGTRKVLYAFMGLGLVDDADKRKA